MNRITVGSSFSWAVVAVFAFASVACSTARKYQPTDGGDAAVDLDVGGTGGGGSAGGSSGPDGMGGTGIVIAGTGGIGAMGGGSGGMIGDMLGPPPALTIAPGTKDFSTVVVGLFAEAAFQISNTGGQSTSMPAVDLDGTDATFFAIAANTCTAVIPGGGNCVVTVKFGPTASGPRSARLNVTATLGGAVSAGLQGLGATRGALSISPTTNPFGSVLQATSSAPATFTVTNTGGEATGVLAVSVAGSTEFAIQTDACHDKSLAAGAMCTITVIFSPSGGGQKSGTLLVSGTPGGTASSGLTGVGLAPATLSVSPMSAPFPTTPLGATSAVRVFTVTNGGGVAAGTMTAVATVLGGANAGDFILAANTCSGMLAAGASCSVSVAFKPTTTGDRAATLTASATPGSPAVASLTGTAVAAAALRLAAATGSSADFGTVVTQNTAVGTFMVSNAGGQATTTLTVAIAGTGFAVAPATTGDCVSGTTMLAPAATCVIHVTLTPTAAGVVMGTLTVSAATGGSAMLALAGTAVSPGALVLTPKMQDFPALLPGAPGTPLNFTVANTGGAISGTLATSIMGSTEFVVATDGCAGKTLAAGIMCTISVRFAPMSAGQKTGTLSVTAAPGGTTTAALMGTGLAPASISISPVPTPFANTVVGMMSVPQTFVVTNSGDVAAGSTTAMVAALSGTDMADFAISANNCMPTLVAKGTCMVSVVFRPQTAGMNKRTTLTASATPGGAPTVALVGNGLAPARLDLAVASGSSTDFGSLVIGGSQNQTFVVSNLGQQSSTAVTVGLPGTDFNVVTPSGTDCVSAPAANATTLAPGATCTVRVRFAPAMAVARMATLTVSAATGGTDTLTLNGMGLAQSALSVSPTSLNFGSVLQSGISTASMITVSNTGGVATGTLAVSLPAGEFALGTNGCTGTLAAGTSCNITVTFRPTSASPTSKTRTLMVTASPGGMGSASLSGLGVSLLIDPTSFDFPATPVFTNSPPRGFAVTNPSNGSSGPLTVTLGGTNPSDFTMGTTTCSGTLGPSSSCNVSFSFRPGTAGAKTATLNASATPGGTATATLTGRGQASDGTFGCTADLDCVSGFCATYYRDADGDGHGSPTNTARVCGFPPPSGYLSSGEDCDDSNPNQFRYTSLCTGANTRSYCLTDAVLRNQTCTGGGCNSGFCLGTVGIAGTLSCGSSTQCTTADGCSWPDNSAAVCGLGNGRISFSCDGPNDCAAGSVCCSQYNCGLSGSTSCFVGQCPPNDPCNTVFQLCNPLASSCPTGLACALNPGTGLDRAAVWTCQ